MSNTQTTHKYKCLTDKDEKFENPHSGCGKSFEVDQETWDLYATAIRCPHCGYVYVKWLTYGI
jgi:hypothetical protein